MSSKPRSRDAEERFPRRILVADVAHPDRDEYELELVPEGREWGNLPVTPYERVDDGCEDCQT